MDRIPSGLPLGSDGPWLVFHDGQGLWAVNADGTGLTRLIDPSSSPESERSLFGLSTSPVGGRLAVVQAARPNGFPHPVLWTARLPEGGIEEVADLLPSGFVPLGDVGYVVLRALTEWNGIAWSPDGRRLAFAGAMDGGSSDLYLYEAATAEVRRLTSGPTQVVGIEWSPDGEWVVHGGAIGFVERAGPPFEVQAQWAARADGSEVRRLYDVGPGSWVDPLVGWLDPRTYVTFSHDNEAAPVAPPHRLRTVGLLGGASTVLRQEHFTDVAMDPESGGLLVVFEPDDFGLIPTDTPGGVRLIDARTATGLTVVEDEAFIARWSSELGLFLVQTRVGVIAVSGLGDFIDLDVPAGAVGLPRPSPAGGELAWVGEGLWLGDLLGSIENPPVQLFGGDTTWATWAPDGSGILFLADGTLLFASRPGFEPAVIAEGMSAPMEDAWLAP